MSVPSAELLTSFNALPSPLNLTDAQRQWHFDIRYWHIEPFPCHILLLFQHASDAAHLLRLPVGLADDEPGHAYFPETVQDAAPEIAKALLQFFLNDWPSDTRGNVVSCPPKPHSFTTYHADLARAVGKQLEKLGVSSTSALRAVGMTSEAILGVAQKRFAEAFLPELDKALYTHGFETSPRPALYVPLRIEFGIPRPEQYNAVDKEWYLNDEEKFDEYVHRYSVSILAATPRPPGPTRGPVAIDRYTVRCASTKKLLRGMSLAQVKAAADGGEASAAIDYGLRRMIAFKCKRNRAVAREYFVKAVTSLVGSLSNEHKAMAHGLLCNWYWEETMRYVNESTCLRQIFAAWHHADWSAHYGIHASPLQLLPSKVVMEAVGPMAGTTAEVLDLQLWYPRVWTSSEAAKFQQQESLARWQRRRAKDVNRYRCAFGGCEVEADSGYRLRKCAGLCDKDKKPSYCSLDCQRLDWDTHKPFCRAGAPCSVKKPDDFGPLMAQAPAREPGGGLLFMPMYNADNTVTLLCSGSMDGIELLDIRDDFIEAESKVNLGPYFLIDPAPNSLEVKNIYVGEYY